MSALAPLAGCQFIGGIAYFLGPKRVEKAEFKLAQGRVAIVVEYERPSDASPVFDRAFHERMVEIYRDEKLAQSKAKSAVTGETEFVAPSRWADLRQSDPDSRTWSIQRIGRELDAEQVLYIRVARLQLRETPDYPILSPQVLLRGRVISSNEPPPHHRLWPTGPMDEGREVSAERPPQEFSGADQIDSEVTKLARMAAYTLSRYFLDTDLEAPTPKER
ncbi:MAG: hypothetical protein U1D55_05900 [Phycisphaerae bacterium]